jgi:phenylpropionate dioxygenase-like ring-hydroxylating dioxygenase large terminal subunit
VLEEPLSDLPSLSWFDPDAWTWGHGTPFELPVGLGVMIENFRDVAHLAFVHQRTLGAMPEVVEPLTVQRDGFEVKMRREMLAGARAEEIWGSLREVLYHAIAPNLASGQMFTVKGQRCLLHAARAIGPTESAHYWIEGFTEDYDEYTLEEAIEFEERVYAEDLPIISGIEPPELPLDPEAGLSTVADRFTLAYRQAFADFVGQALAERSAQPSSTAS